MEEVPPTWSSNICSMVLSSLRTQVASLVRDVLKDRQYRQQCLGRGLWARAYRVVTMVMVVTRAIMTTAIVVTRALVTMAMVVTRAMVVAMAIIVTRIMMARSDKGPYLALAVWRPRARFAHLRSMTIFEFLEAFRSRRAKRVRRLL